MPNQTPGALTQYGLTRADADHDAWVITSSGERFAGAAAVTQVLATLGGRWGVLAAILGFPPVAWLARRAYRWIATNRSRLSGVWGTVPECSRPGVNCDRAR